MGVDIVMTGAVADDLRRREFQAFEHGAGAYNTNMAQAGRSGRARLLGLADLGPGMSLLDVCTGPGWLAIEGAASCPGGRVVGVDLSSAMLRHARANAAAAGRDDLEFAVMDAQALDLPDASIDRVVCGLGLMHTPDPRAALSEMARVARPGGRVALSVWGGASETILGTLAQALRAVAGDGQVLDYGYVTRLGEGDAVKGVVAGSGWREVTLERFDSGAVVPDAAMIWPAFASGTTFGTLVGDLPPADREKVREEFIGLCEAFRRPDGLHIPTVQLLVSAIR